MKHLRFFAAVMAAAACLWACTPEENPTPGGNTDDPTEKPTDKPGEVTPEIAVSPATVAFEADGGTLRVAVTTNVDTYSVTGAPDWLTVAQNGSEINLTAAQNTVAEVRECALTVAAETASCTLTVTQKAGSPYAGFAVVSKGMLEYAGTMLYQFIKPKEGYDGGMAYLAIGDEGGDAISAWIYTELFASEEEVELTSGTYVKGEDEYPFGLCARKLTYMPGQLYIMDDEDDESAYMAGTYFVSGTTGEEIALVDGTIEVVAESDGTYTIKMDMVDADGNTYKYLYMGEVPIFTEGAGYPSGNERIDVASTIFATQLYYNGDTYGVGAANFALLLYSGDPDDVQNAAMTQFEFNTEFVEFSEDLDLSGTYITPEDESGLLQPGTITPGYMMEIWEGFSFPMGTYVMYSFGDYLIGDSYASLILEKQANGHYNLSGAITNTEGEYVMFLNIADLDIPLADATNMED